MRPTHAQQQSIAELIQLGTVKDENGEATEWNPAVYPIPAGWNPAPVPALFGASEVVSAWWGTCWPEDFSDE